MNKRKYALIMSKEGLRISLEVLKRLRRRPKIREYEIIVGCFTNCREVGLTFFPSMKNDKYLNHSKTFCIYEHRNSDSIIINGKDGYVSGYEELPYKADNKWDVIAEAKCGEYDKATDLLVKEILKIKN